MLDVMLCGAEDTERVAGRFREVVEACGGNPLHYLSGDIHYINSLASDWTANSRTTVEEADVCVFAIVERFGEITWGTELRTALSSGIPFLVLCLGKTYDKYRTLTRSLSSLDAIRDDSDRRLVEALSETEEALHLTLVRFDYDDFEQVLRKHLAALFREGLLAVKTRNRRQVLAPLLYNAERLSTSDLARAAEIVQDELEDKTLRKQALLALAIRGACDEHTLQAALLSSEQGVRRLAIQELKRLHRGDAPDVELLEQVVAAVNLADDVGLARRLVPALFEFGVSVAVPALEGLQIAEIGTRRRIAEALADTEEEILTAGLAERALRLARRCQEGAVPEDWKVRLTALISRLEAVG